MNLLQIIRTVIALSSVFPLQAIVKFVQAGLPLPPWGDPIAVGAWCDRVGITGLLKDLLIASLPKDQGVVPAGLPPIEINEEEIRGLVECELADASDSNVPEFGIISAVLLTNAVIQIIKAINSKVES